MIQNLDLKQVKKEETNTKRTVIKSMVGTLDLSIRYLLQGETFPAVKNETFCSEQNHDCNWDLQSIFLNPNIYFLLQERVNVPLFCHTSRTGPNRYGYISNLCVAKSARRQGVATNMMYFALQSAKNTGTVSNMIISQTIPSFQFSKADSDSIFCVYLCGRCGDGVCTCSQT